MQVPTKYWMGLGQDGKNRDAAPSHRKHIFIQEGDQTQAASFPSLLADLLSDRSHVASETVQTTSKPTNRLRPDVDQSSDSKRVQEMANQDLQPVWGNKQSATSHHPLGQPIGEDGLKMGF
jgi:hypothetical protein